MVFDDHLAHIKKKWAEQLKAYRKELGLNAEEVAERVGLHRTMIHKIEAGQIGSIDTIARILKEYGLTFDDFLDVFTNKDVPEDHKEDHRKLKVILGSKYRAQIAGIRAELGSVYNAVVALQQAHPPPGGKRRHVSSQ